MIKPPFNPLIPHYLHRSQTHYLVVVDLEGNYVYVNNHFQNRFKLVFSEFIGESYLGSIAEEDHYICKEVVSKCFENPSETFQLVLRKPHHLQDLYYWTQWEFCAHIQEDGSNEGITCLGHDFNPEGEALFNPKILTKPESQSIDRSHPLPDTILTLDQNLFIKDYFVNLNGESPISQPPQIGKPLSEILAKDLFFSIQEALDLSVKNKKSEIIEFDFFKAGKRCHYESRIIPMSGSDIMLVTRDITERKQLKKQLEKTDRIYLDLINNLSAGVYKFSEKNHFIYVSPKWCEITGFESEAILSGQKDVFSNIHEDDMERVIAENKKAITEKIPLEIEFRLYVKGKTRWAKVSSTPYKNSEGHWEWHGIHHDITDIKEAEQILVESDQILRKLSTQLPGVIYQFKIDAEGTASFPFMSSNVANIIGVPYEEIEKDYRLMFDTIVEEDREANDFSIRESYKNLTSWENTFRIIHPIHNKLMWVYAKSTPEKLADGSIVWNGFLTDVTEEKKATEKQRFQAALLENVGQAVIVTDLVGKVTYWNEYATQLYGFTASEMQGNLLFLKLPILDDPALFDWETLFEKLEKGEKIIENYTFKRKDNSTFISRVQKNGFLDEAGKLKNIISISTDVTKEILQSKELKRQKEFNQWLVEVHQLFLTSSKSNYRKFFDAILLKLLEFTGSEYGFIGEVKYHPNGEPYMKTYAISNISWNEESSKFYEENAPQGMEFTNLKTLFGRVMTHKEVVISNQPASDPRGLRKMPDGHPPLNHFMGLPFIVDDKIVGICGLANKPGGYNEEIATFLEPFTFSISTFIESIRSEMEKLAAEQELQYALQLLNTKNERLREFTYIVSHNIRSHASNFKGLIEIAKPERNIETRDMYLELMEGAANKLLDTLSHLNDLFYVQQNAEVKTEKINLKKVLEDVLTSIRYDIIHNQVKIILDFEPEFEIQFNLAYIDSILLNLLTNAIKYRKEGRIPEITVSAGKTKDNKVYIAVKDNGLGIDLKMHKNKLFGMYQTFHRNKDARGLGLFITKHQVEAMGGSIEVESKINQGASFKIVIPWEK